MAPQSASKNDPALSRSTQSRHANERRPRKTKPVRNGSTPVDAVRLAAERDAATFPFHNDKGE
jgi:hypothetical protein